MKAASTGKKDLYRQGERPLRCYTWKKYNQQPKNMILAGDYHLHEESTKKA
jgi:hypothetical protein